MSVNATAPPVVSNPLVTVSRSYLDGLNMWLLILVAFTIAFFVLLIYFLQDKYRTPKPSNNLTKAHRKHIPLILLEGLDHIADLYPLRDFIPEVLQTDAFGKAPKKRSYRFILPVKTNLEDVNISVAHGKDPVLTLKVIKALNDLNTQKVTLRGTSIPVLVGVKNRSIAASMPFLGALSWLKDLENISTQMATIQAMQHSTNQQIKAIGDMLARMATGVSLVDFQAVYEHVDVNYDHTINESISERDKTDGRLEGKDDKDKQTKTVLLLGVFMCLLLVIGIVAAKVL